MNDLTFVIDVAFVLSAVAFFKEQLKLQGYWVLVAAFAVTVFAAFLPDLMALAPAATPYVEKLALIVKLFLTAPGLFDLIADLKSR